MPVGGLLLGGGLSIIGRLLVKVSFSGRLLLVSSTEESLLSEVSYADVWFIAKVLVDTASI